MTARKPIHELNEMHDIVRKPSANAIIRAQWLANRKAAGCELCSSHDRIAWWPKSPSNTFNIQAAGIRIPMDELEREMDKQVLICVSCRMLVLGNRRSPARVKNKTLFEALRKAYPPPPEIPKKPKKIKR